MEQNNNVIEVTPETQEEYNITQALVKENVTEKVIAAYKERYKGLVLKSVDDKEGYLEIKQARKEVRQLGILTEKICKKGREDAVRTQKLWLRKEDEILGKINEIQNPLDAEIKRFEDEEQRKEQAEATRKANEFLQRQTTLLKMGANFIDGNFVLSHISYEASMIREADQDIWENTILKKYKDEFERLSAVFLEEENKRKEEIEKLRKEKEELEKQKRELEEQRQEILKQQQEQDRIKKEQEQKAQKEKDEIFQRMLNNRRNELASLGFTFDMGADTESAYVLGDVKIPMTDVTSLYDSQWKFMMDTTMPAINKAKADREQKQREEIARQEREKIEEENRQAELQKQREELERQTQIEQADDKTKWDYLLVQLGAIEVPTMKSKLYRQKVQQVKEKFEEINEL